MAAVTPNPAPLAAAVQPAAVTRKRTGRLGLGSLFGWCSTKGCSHALKLRHSFKVDSRTRMELGLDMDVVDDHGLKQMLHSSAPWAALWYQLDEKDSTKGCVELNPLWVAYHREVSVGRKGTWWEVPLDAKLGATFTGKPFVQVGIGNLPLALGLAAALLAAGKSISLERKEVGGLAVRFSGGSALQERVEFDAKLQREGRGLKLDFSQLNGVLRLRQD